MLEKLQKFMWISGLSRLVNLPMQDKGTVCLQERHSNKGTFL